MKIFDKYRITDTKVNSSGRLTSDPQIHRTVVSITLSNKQTVVIDLDQNTLTDTLTSAVRCVD